MARIYMTRTIQLTSLSASFPQVRQAIDQGKSPDQIRAELLKRVSQAYAARKAILPGRVR